MNRSTKRSRHKSVLHDLKIGEVCKVTVYIGDKKKYYLHYIQNGILPKRTFKTWTRKITF